MATFTNKWDIPLPVAVWLASSSYDFKPTPRALSATDFNKSIRQIILRNRMAEMPDKSTHTTDVIKLFKSKLGTAIHDAIERVWVTDYILNNALLSLGFSESYVENIQINPTPETLREGSAAIYAEQRGDITINGFTISGKFDFVMDGILHDYKSTGIWKWNSRDEAADAYRVQGSIYKLIFKNIIFEDYMKILFILPEWSESKLEQAKEGTFPPIPSTEFIVKLMSTYEVTKFIYEFTNAIKKYENCPEEELPYCESKHLWQNKPVYKYYKNPNGDMKRSNGNFDNYYAARQKMIANGNVGIIKTVESKVAACNYCPAAKYCSQRAELDKAGMLKKSRFV